MSIRHPLRFLVAGLALGAAFDLMFWGKAPGISILIYVILLLAGLGLALRWQDARALPANLWMPGLLILFSIMAFVRANSFLIFLNILAILTLLMLISNNLVRRATWTLKISDLVLEPVRSGVYTLVGTARIIRSSHQSLVSDGQGKHMKRLQAILVGLLISLPILLVLIPLLVSADLIFAAWLHDFFSWEKVIKWGFRLSFMLIIGLLAGGALLYTAQKHTPEPDLFNPPTSRAQKDHAARARPLGPIETLIPINLVNLLFFTFILIQISYLFGGRVNISEHGFTYAEYARRGFAELVIVALFIFFVILTLHRLSHLESPRSRRAFNLSATLLLLLTMVLLISAFKRLALYESAYGFTTMRIYPHVFMVWLGVLLIWFVFTLWFAPDRLAVGVLAAAFGFVLTLNILNPDAFIVHQNVAHYRAHGGQFASFSDNRIVDVYYFQRLSADAVPALIEELPNLGGARAIVEEDLKRRYQTMQEDEGWRRWQSWNLSRWRAYQWLKAYFE